MLAKNVIVIYKVIHHITVSTSFCNMNSIILILKDGKIKIIISFIIINGIHIINAIIINNIILNRKYHTI